MLLLAVPSVVSDSEICFPVDLFVALCSGCPGERNPRGSLMLGNGIASLIPGNISLNVKASRMSILHFHNFFFKVFSEGLIGC